MWTLAALLVCKSVAGPNLSEAFMWFTIGVLAQHAWRATPVPRYPHLENYATKSTMQKLADEKLS